MKSAVYQTIGAVDAELSGAFAEACLLAEGLMKRVEVFFVPHSGEFLAEVPGHEFEFWALGESPEAAKVRLLGIVAGKLQERLRRLGPTTGASTVKLGGTAE